MAQRDLAMRSLAVRRALHPGSLAAFGIGALVLCAFLALLLAAGDRTTLLSIGPYLVRIVAFSVAQAAMSTILSVALGVAIALALARRRFPGKRLALAGLGAAAVMPAIVVVFSVLAVYGRSGWAAGALAFLGVETEIGIFGWPGILAAHVFLNAPLVARGVVDALGTAPAEHWRLAAALGFGPAQVWRHIDVPILRSELPGLAGVVFLLCFTSFAIVLSLGGGPARATLEVAIYEAIKVDLDFGRAAWLAFIQIGICVAFTLLVHSTVDRAHLGHTLRQPVWRPDAAHGGLAVADILVLLAAGAFLLPMLLSVLTGLPSLPRVLDWDLAMAFATSLAISFAASMTACLLALALSAAARAYRAGGRPRVAVVHDIVPSALLAVPPFALVAGLFLIVRRVMDPAAAGYLLLPLMNGLAALPFAYSFINPKLAGAGERYGRLADLWGISGWARLRLVDWPAVRPAFASAFALAMALSFGDFGVVALFGGTGLRTLPYLLYERLGAYRFEEGAAIGCLIMLFAFGLAHLSGRFAHADRG